MRGKLPQRVHYIEAVDGEQGKTQQEDADDGDEILWLDDAIDGAEEVDNKPVLEGGKLNYKEDNASGQRIADNRQQIVDDGKQTRERKKEILEELTNTKMMQWTVTKKESSGQQIVDYGQRIADYGWRIVDYGQWKADSEREREKEERKKERNTNVNVS